VKSQLTIRIRALERRLPGADEPAPDWETVRRHQTAALLMEAALFLAGPTGRDPAARRCKLQPLLPRLSQLVAEVSEPSAPSTLSTQGQPL